MPGRGGDAELAALGGDAKIGLHRDRRRAARAEAAEEKGSEAVPLSLREGIGEGSRTLSRSVSRAHEVRGDAAGGQALVAYPHSISITPLPLRFEQTASTVPAKAN